MSALFLLKTSTNPLTKLIILYNQQATQVIWTRWIRITSAMRLPSSGKLSIIFCKHKNINFWQIRLDFFSRLTRFSKQKKLIVQNYGIDILISWNSKYEWKKRGMSLDSILKMMVKSRTTDEEAHPRGR